ncbi:uncharacterized protein LOC143635274 [Bidens hawaiensis]|uniref:uncharacterized protein LOC143635274 n=1 Tax=Bidens hawaiensis TaxID=980011 RepID=UPI0040492894
METISRATNSLMLEELSYDTETMNNEFNNLFDSLTDEQRGVYNEIMNALVDKKGSVFFVYCYGGTGKIYLWKTISASIRSKGEVVLNVASSGIAYLLLKGRRTTHSRFLIPINLTEDSICPGDSANTSEALFGDISQGRLGGPNDGEPVIDIPDDLLILNSVDPIGDLISFVYPNILDRFNELTYFQDRALLAPLNEVVQEINERMLTLFPGEEVEYLSSDSLAECEDVSDAVDP